MGATGEDRQFRTLERLLAIQATDLKAALTEASQLMAGVLSADKVDVFLHDPTIETLVAVGTSDTPMGRHQHALGLDRLPLANGGRAVEVYQTGQSHRDGRVDADPHELLGVREALGVRSTLAVPLDVAGERRGVLQASSAQPEHFGEGDLAFLAAVAGWVGTVAHRAELVEQLRAEAVERARRATADELVAALAHDLRNPLQAVSGQLGMLRSRARREGQARYLANAEAGLAALARVEQLIGDLLDAERLEQGLFALSPRPIDLCLLVAEAAGLLQTDTTQIAVQGPAEVPAVVDPEQLRRALENLLANAVRHSPRGAPVEVTLATEVREGGEWTTIDVRDRGAGIPAEQQPRLFERFATGPDSRGLGLGLYLARQITEAHGGTLTLDDSGPTGTTFRFALPVDGPGSAGAPTAPR